MKKARFFQALLIVAVAAVVCVLAQVPATKTIAVSKVCDVSQMDKPINGMDVYDTIAQGRPGSVSFHSLIAMNLNWSAPYRTIVQVEFFTRRTDEKTGNDVLSERPVETLVAGPAETKGGQGGVYQVYGSAPLPKGNYKGWINLLLEDDRGAFGRKACHSFLCRVP